MMYSLKNPELLLNYTDHNVNINRHVQKNPKAVQGLLALIQAISSAVQSNNIHQFDNENQLCTECDKHGCSFDSCPLLKNSMDLKQL